MQLLYEEVQGILFYKKGCFVGKIVRGNPARGSEKFKFPEKIVVSSFEVKMRECFHKNFAERVVILLNCPKVRNVT